MTSFLRKISLRKLFCLHLLIWLVLELIVNPVGNFPLNDDWAYAQNVYFLTEEGRFDFSDWPAMTLIAQVLWGSLFCKIFGFSFTVLRFSTLLLAVGGSWAAFLLFRRYTSNRLVAYGAGLLLILNPLFFVLANSFMTEVPFLAAFLPALYCYVRMLDEPFSKNKMRYWLGGTLFSILATMVRQPALLLTLAFGAAYFFQNLKQLKFKDLLLTGLPFIAAFSTYKAYGIWLKATQPLPPTYGEIGKLFAPFWDGTLVNKLLTRNNELLFYAGWFLLPATLFLFAHYWKNSSKFQKGTAAVIAMLITSTAFYRFHVFPMGNVFGNLRLGPKTVFHDRRKILLHEFSVAEEFWIAIKIIGVVGGLLLLFQLVLAIFDHFAKKKWSHLLSLLFIMGYYVFFILNPFYCDRYTLIFIPFFISLLIPNTEIIYVSKSGKYLALIVFLIIAYFSIAGTKDYLSWNRVRWEIANEINVENKVPVEQLYAGFEYYSWYARPELWPDAANHFKDTTIYAISFESAICGYENIKDYPYNRWLPPGKGHLYLQQKNEENPSREIFCNTELTANAAGDLITSDSSVILVNRAKQDSTYSLSGKYSIRLHEKRRYSFNTDLLIDSDCFFIKASVWRKRTEEDRESGAKYPAVIVVTTDDFHLNEPQVVKRTPDGWEKIETQIQMAGHTNSDKVKIYVWNNSGETQWFDDFRVEVRTD